VSVNLGFGELLRYRRGFVYFDDRGEVRPV